MVKNGAIGDLISGNCYSNTMASPFVARQPGWTDMEYMLRNRGNWIWLTGDTIVNMLVHTIDILNWFFEKYPVNATGFGGRHRRHVGDMYDFFSVDFAFDDNRRYQGMCRQMDGCDNKGGVLLFGSKGYTNCQDSIWDYDNNPIWQYQYPPDDQGRPGNRLALSPFTQSHINMVTAIRTNNPVNEPVAMASSTLIGLMGRESAYTGRDVTWNDMMNSNLDLLPEKVHLGPIDIKPVIPVPGT
jgi:myo-inositol 2-dehydrogenase / D-chiro-inositol 1-dehydrogenase